VFRSLYICEIPRDGTWSNSCRYSLSSHLQVVEISESTSPQVYSLRAVPKDPFGFGPRYSMDRRNTPPFERGSDILRHCGKKTMVAVTAEAVYSTGATNGRCISWTSVE